MGDEGHGYEDEAGAEEAYYLKQMQKEAQRAQKVYKREPTEKVCICPLFDQRASSTPTSDLVR